AVDPHPQRLAIEAQENEPDVRIARDIAQGPVHRVAVVLGELDDIRADDPHEAGIARLDVAVDVVTPGGGNEEERRSLDQLAIGIPELVVPPMALERVGDPPAVEAVLQLAHAFMEKRSVAHCVSSLDSLAASLCRHHTWRFREAGW